MNHRLLLPPLAVETERWATSDTPRWVPSGWTTSVACGDYFDAVRVPADVAVPALSVLGPRTGPVLANNTTRTWHFLILRPHRAEPGNWGRGARVMPDGRSIGIPPTHRAGGRDVYWAVPPNGFVTSPLRLREVLEGPLPPAAPTSTRTVAAPPPPVRVPPVARPLTPTGVQLRIGALLLAGETEEQIAVRLRMQVATVRRHLTQLGTRLGATTTTGRATALLSAGHLPPPAVSMLAPDLASLDVQILRVVAGLAPADELPDNLRSGESFLDRVAHLRHVTGARADAHLVALGFAWGLLPGGTP
ncbi:hypothetical protein ACFWPP_11675 [Streptomyces anulatus]|uniref:hypothetical protein n=1 Tax=Streptomyces anulatus TaxID=1892 RepID=UPI003647BE7B